MGRVCGASWIYTVASLRQSDWTTMAKWCSFRHPQYVWAMKRGNPESSSAP